MLTQNERKTILTADVKTRAVVYCRVSTDEQAESGTSIEGQARAGADYATKAGLEVVATFKEDYTGTTLDRPELNKVMAMLRAGQADALIVYKPDRLDRSWMGRNTLIIMQALMSIGAELHYSETAHKVDFNNPMDVFMWGSLGGWQAGVDRDNTVKKLAKGRVDRAKQGFVVPMGPHPAYGYRKVKREDKKWYLEIDPKRADVVRMIFNWYVSGDETGIGLSHIQIAEKLRAMGIPALRSKNGWDHTTIGHIIRNETYAGVWYFGKAGAMDNIPVTVPAIVDRPLFEQAQDLRKFKNTHKANKGTPLLLSNLAYCPICNRVMSKAGAKILYYQCSQCNQRRQPVPKKLCTHKTCYPAGAIDNAVWAEIKALLTDPERRRAGVEAYRKRQAGNATPLLAELQATEAAIKRIEGELNQLYDAFKNAPSPRSRATYTVDIERTEGQLEELEASRNRLAQQITETAGTKEAAAKLDKIFELMAQRIDVISGDLTSKRQVLKQLGLQAVIGTDNEGRQYVTITSKISVQNVYIDDNSTHNIPANVITLFQSIIFL